MNVKFVVGGLAVIGTLFLGNELYWGHKFEQQAREDFKKIGITPDMQAAMGSMPLKVDVLNQYPNIHYYMNFTRDIPESDIDFNNSKYYVFKQTSNALSCGYFNHIMSMESDSKYKDKSKAVIKVVEQDKVTISHTIKDRRGEVLYEQKQVLSECPNFATLKQSV